MKLPARMVRNPEMRGGALTIDGTRITVTDIVRYSWMYLSEVAAQLAEPPDPQLGLVIPVAGIVKRIREGLPHLSPQQVVAALTYWHDHKEEVEKELAEEDAAALELQRKYPKLP